MNVEFGTVNFVDFTIMFSDERVQREVVHINRMELTKSDSAWPERVIWTWKRPDYRYETPFYTDEQEVIETAFKNYIADSILR